jgi:lysophospholipase L1-like esterase
VLPVSDYHKDVNPNYEMTKQRSPSLIRSLNGWMQSFCSDRGYTYLDYFAAMVDDAGMLKTDLANDGLHPNSEGYRIMAPLALAAINSTVGTGTPAPPQRQPRKKRLFSK